MLEEGKQLLEKKERLTQKFLYSKYKREKLPKRKRKTGGSVLCNGTEGTGQKNADEEDWAVGLKGVGAGHSTEAPCQVILLLNIRMIKGLHSAWVCYIPLLHFLVGKSCWQRANQKSHIPIELLYALSYLSPSNCFIYTNAQNKFSGKYIYTEEFYKLTQ